MISVIIPVYNAEKHLKQSIDSVLSQTYQDIEIICVNDGSTDNSLNILETYSDSIQIVNQSNSGQCIASNNGLKLASGDFIKFFDADDLMNPEHLELQLEKLGTRTDALASCEWGRFYHNKPETALFIKENVWRDLPSFTWIKTALSQRNDMMGAWLWLIPRNVMKKAGGWNEKLSLNNDFEFSIRLLLSCKEVLFTPGARLYYRSGNTSSLAATKSKDAYSAALLSTDLGCSYLLNVNNSCEIRRLCANRYQEWVYRIYPNYPHLIDETERKIRDLGGSNIKIEGGRIFNLLTFIFGWKITKKIQIYIYNLGYKPSPK